MVRSDPGFVLTFLFVMAFLVTCACFTAVVANAKGYKILPWFLAGLCFTLIALIAIAGMPVKQFAAPPKN